MGGLQVDSRCETPDGDGTVVKITTSTRWRPAWVLVRRDDGQARWYRPVDVRPR